MVENGLDWPQPERQINIYFLNISFFLCAKLPESNYRISFISAFALNCECSNNYFHFCPQEMCSARNHEETSALHLHRPQEVIICLFVNCWGEMRKMKSWLSYFCFRFVLFVSFLFNDFKVCAELHDCLRDNYPAC